MNEYNNIKVGDLVRHVQGHRGKVALVLSLFTHWRVLGEGGIPAARVVWTNRSGVYTQLTENLRVVR
jgi:hypothetical protein